MATFNMTRPLHTAQGVGMGRAAHDYALDFVRTDYPAQGRRRQKALERLADIRRGLQTARLMYLNAVWLAKTSQNNVLEASFAKMYSPPVVLRAVVTALDILGEAGCPQRPDAGEAVPGREDPRHRRGHPAGPAGGRGPPAARLPPRCLT